VLIKLNQIGTVTESLAAIRLTPAGWMVADHQHSLRRDRRMLSSSTLQWLATPDGSRLDLFAEVSALQNGMK
jgi:Enolase, C-terminal TIM barrel domain